MQTLESLRNKIGSAEDLLAVVKTMKALAAVNIRHYERAVAALAEYNRTIEMGLHILLRAPRKHKVIATPGAGGRLGAIVFGSDQGLCGQFNERIVRYALEAMDGMGAPPEQRTILAVGERVTYLLMDAKQPVATSLATPSGIGGITLLVQDLLPILDQWRTADEIDRILIFHNRPISGALYEQAIAHLLPLDLDWLQHLEAEPWPSRSLPTFTMPWPSLFSALIQHYLFVSLYRACAESLASEDASRLASMQNAERNIQERLDDLTAHYHHVRQDTITAELLDIVSGWEAVTVGQK